MIGSAEGGGLLHKITKKQQLGEVRTVAGARGDEMTTKALGGTLLTGEMEERSALRGKHCSIWKDLTTAQWKKTKERSPWCLICLKHSSALAFPSCGLDDRISISTG